MSQSLKWRLILVFGIGVLALLALMPTLMDVSGMAGASSWGRKLNLGLDLQGGLQLELKVETDKAIEQSLSTLGDQLGRELRDERVRVVNLDIRPEEINLTVRGEEGSKKLEELLESNYPGLKVDSREMGSGEAYSYSLVFTPEEKDAIASYAIDQGIETIRNRIDQFGVAEPTIVPQGEGEILIQLPGLGALSADEVAATLRDMLAADGKEDAVVTPKGTEVRVTLSDMSAAEEFAKEVTSKINGLVKDKIELTPDGRADLVLALATSQRAKKLIEETAHLEFRIVHNSMSAQQALAQGIPPGYEVLYGKAPVDKRTGKVSGERPAYLVSRRVLMTGDVISNASMNVDQRRLEYYVMIDFDSRGTKLFGDITTEHTQELMAIVLDGVVQSAPVIREPITGGRASISGTFTREEARDLAISLRSGSLPAPVSVMHEIEVGATLGEDSITAGLTALAAGFVLVVMFMVIYYKGAGVLAVLALALNVVLILGALSVFGATLTLPGIAGIVLTVGMAVDANVLIFERIREELRLGKSAYNSVGSGYAKAFSTIFDANITTLIAAVVLGYLGTGPIRGFAVTLGIGIIASMFTAIVGTRVGFDLILSGRSVKRLSI